MCNLKVDFWELLASLTISAKASQKTLLYKISFSCYITGVDADHGMEVYLMDDTGAAIKDFDYKLEQETLSQMNYSRVVLFRFEKTTVLSVSVVLIGDKGTSNVKVSDTNLVLEKIHE